MGSDPQYAKYPDLSLAQSIFTITSKHASNQDQENALQKLQKSIEEFQMTALYQYLAHPTEGILNTSGEGGSSKTTGASHTGAAAGLMAIDQDHVTKLPWDEALYEKLRAQNEEELAGFAKEEEQAAESAGEIEIQAARSKRAEFYARIGDKEKALEGYEAIFEKTGAVGTKIDLVLAMIRVGFFFDDKLLVKQLIERAATLVESGGDWDRRNRLKAYQGLHFLSIRSYTLAAPLLLDSLSTFTSYELCSYSSLVVYAVLAGSVALKRVDFKSRVVDAPEIKAILGDGESQSDDQEKDQDMTDASATPSAPSAAVNLATLGTGAEAQPDSEVPIDFSALTGLVRNLYVGNYKEFFVALANTEEQFLTTDRYLFEHRVWYVREMRLRGYQQLLHSYRIVGLKNMAEAFGVSVDFLDRDLAKFIASNRIPCSIDRVNGIIETNRPDDKNKQYSNVVKQGDALITKLQKYGQAVRLRGSERA